MTTPEDRALLAEIAERDRRWSEGDEPRKVTAIAGWDRRELLRIVHALETLLRERDTQAGDRADDAAAERATAGKWK